VRDGHSGISGVPLPCLRRQVLVAVEVQTEKLDVSLGEPSELFVEPFERINGLLLSVLLLPDVRFGEGAPDVFKLAVGLRDDPEHGWGEDASSGPFPEATVGGTFTGTGAKSERGQLRPEPCGCFGQRCPVCKVRVQAR